MQKRSMARISRGWKGYNRGGRRLFQNKLGGPGQATVEPAFGVVCFCNSSLRASFIQNSFLVLVYIAM